ncbi:hypothetical protein EZV73_04540 [Acidaminobacter sp. JC074]|uniref:hypothetical protein n=1 Tax=Acidaminobacter sp. JC074 TaxID=2530199 RepID=UPI001F0D0E1A|nr:hypothetical protein [Acidaminobacter sp. JC074]MCH4886822.1 hypothetical protein [Acidaminobacter sp. JC074]
MKYKTWYVLLAIGSVTYTFVITFLNIFVYGSVIQWNLSVLSLINIMPLYLGFSQKRFDKKAARMMTSFMAIILVITMLVLPKYTYKQAYGHFDNGISTLRKHVGQSSFFYQGDYYIKTEAGSFSFDIRTGEIKGVEDEYK